MRQFRGTAPGALRLAGRGADLSPEAKRRLKWMDYYDQHGSNARLTCRHFDVSPQTFYRWRRRYDPRRLASLEDRSRRPHRVRRGTWSSEVEQAVLQLREEYPRWGKDKLVRLLHDQGVSPSTSMVGRILTSLKTRGLLVEPLRSARPARRSWTPRPYATPKPKAYIPHAPGDLVQVDTLDLRPVPGVILKQFTARDVVSRWDVLGIARQASATSAAAFLNAIDARMPFPVQAIQVDGGSEFMAGFEEACQKRGIRLFVLPPRSPKLNGCVERAQRTHQEEFYEVADLDWTVAALGPPLLAWEAVYNTVRPHQALGYRTPQQFLEELAGAKQ